MVIQKIYQYALLREREGKKFFEDNASRLQHASAVGAFKKLAVEEQKHIEFIEHQIALLDKGQPSSAAMAKDMEAAGFFTQRASSEFIDQSIAESMVADLPVLRMAYLIERDFSEFYEQSAAAAEGDAQKVLEMLAGWERRHEAFFKQMHDRLFEEYARMPWGG